MLMGFYLAPLRHHGKLHFGHVKRMRRGKTAIMSWMIVEHCIGSSTQLVYGLVFPFARGGIGVSQQMYTVI